MQQCVLPEDPNRTDRTPALKDWGRNLLLLELSNCWFLHLQILGGSLWVTSDEANAALSDFVVNLVSLLVSL